MLAHLKCLADLDCVADLDYLGTRTPDDNRNYLQAHNDPYKACEAFNHAIAIMTEWDELKPSTGSASTAT